MSEDRPRRFFESGEPSSCYEPWMICPVDGIVILDTSWFPDDRPSLDYGFRGITYMSVDIIGPSKVDIP